MECEFIWAEDEARLPRRYIAVATLNNFRGKKNVEAHIFRTGASENEMEALKYKNLVSPADPSVPAEVLSGATEEMALACLLEAFTRDEALKLANYLENRYKTQISRLEICPMNLPAPFGIGPLAMIPETEKIQLKRFAFYHLYIRDVRYRNRGKIRLPRNRAQARELRTVKFYKIIIVRMLVIKSLKHFRSIIVRINHLFIAK